MNWRLLPRNKRRCSLLSTCSKERSLADVCSAIVTRSSFASSHAIEAQVPASKVCAENVISPTATAVHKHPKVRQWLNRHPRFAFHFTPTSCSAGSTQLEGSSPNSPSSASSAVSSNLVDLPATINRFVAQTNHDPKPFTWTRQIQTASSPPSGVGTKR